MHRRPNKDDVERKNRDARARGQRGNKRTVHQVAHGLSMRSQQHQCDHRNRQYEAQVHLADDDVCVTLSPSATTTTAGSIVITRRTQSGTVKPMSFA